MDVIDLANVINELREAIEDLVTERNELKSALDELQKKYNRLFDSYDRLYCKSLEDDAIMEAMRR